MSRHIDADKALQSAIEEKRFFIYFEDALNQQFVVNTIYSDLADFLNSQPAVDVVEVVRCRDCKHYVLNTLGIKFCSEPCGLTLASDETFCSYGERKNDGRKD